MRRFSSSSLAASLLAIAVLAPGRAGAEQPASAGADTTCAPPPVSLAVCGFTLPSIMSIFRIADDRKGTRPVVPSVLGTAQTLGVLREQPLGMRATFGFVAKF
jgi:hypothetical protein